MHELSIAISIVNICIEEARKADSGRVIQVEVKIGSLSGVETEALAFSWDVATKNSIVDGAPLVIQKVEAQAKCKSCNSEFTIDNFFSPCPSCGEYGYEIVKGKELQIKAITVE